MWKHRLEVKHQNELLLHTKRAAHSNAVLVFAGDWKSELAIEYGEEFYPIYLLLRFTVDNYNHSDARLESFISFSMF